MYGVWYLLDIAVVITRRTCKSHVVYWQDSRDGKHAVDRTYLTTWTLIIDMLFDQVSMFDSQRAPCAARTPNVKLDHRWLLAC